MVGKKYSHSYTASRDKNFPGCDASNSVSKLSIWVEIPEKVKYVQQLTSFICTLVLRLIWHACGCRLLSVCTCLVFLLPFHVYKYDLVRSCPIPSLKSNDHFKHLFTSIAIFWGLSHFSVAVQAIWTRQILEERFALGLTGSNHGREHDSRQSAMAVEQ